MNTEIIEKAVTFPQIWDTFENGTLTRKERFEKHWDYLAEHYLKPMLSDQMTIHPQLKGSENALWKDFENQMKPTCAWPFDHIMDYAKMTAEACVEELFGEV